MSPVPVPFATTQTHCILAGMFLARSFSAFSRALGVSDFRNATWPSAQTGSWASTLPPLGAGARRAGALAAGRAAQRASRAVGRGDGQGRGRGRGGAAERGVVDRRRGDSHCRASGRGGRAVFFPSAPPRGELQVATSRR